MLLFCKLVQVNIRCLGIVKIGILKGRGRVPLLSSHMTHTHTRSLSLSLSLALALARSSCDAMPELESAFASFFSSLLPCLEECPTAMKLKIPQLVDVIPYAIKCSKKDELKVRIEPGKGKNYLYIFGFYICYYFQVVLCKWIFLCVKISPPTFQLPIGSMSSFASEACLLECLEELLSYAMIAETRAFEISSKEEQMHATAQVKRKLTFEDEQQNSPSHKRAKMSGNLANGVDDDEQDLMIVEGDVDQVHVLNDQFVQHRKCAFLRELVDLFVNIPSESTTKYPAGKLAGLCNQIRLVVRVFLINRSVIPEKNLLPVLAQFSKWCSFFSRLTSMDYLALEAVLDTIIILLHTLGG